MLLYTRLAPPKVPKRRSRAGCTYCKEKKKKCDEGRPQCSRCAERSLDCTYEAVRPRQRRKRESNASVLGHDMKSGVGMRRYSEASHASDSSEDSPSQEWFEGKIEPGADDAILDHDVFSPVESTFDTASMATYTSTNMTSLSPGTSAAFDLTEIEEEKPVELVASKSLAIRRDSSTALVAKPKSRCPDLAMIAPSPIISPLGDFFAPSFSEFSDKPNRRALVDHFCNILSHLIVFREETGNPFQQLVLPLTQNSSPVKNAIYALASAHLEYRGLENGEKSLVFHNQAIQGLARLIEQQDKVNRNELLAAIMLLVYYEVLVQRGRSNIVEGHLKGAITIMTSTPTSNDPTSVFLERAFGFYDVIAALSFGTPPLSATPRQGGLTPFSPIGAPAGSPLSNVDALLGLATTLWPIIHRLSQLRSLKADLEKELDANPTSSKAAVLRTELQTASEVIENNLQAWQPCLPPNFVPDDDACAEPMPSRPPRNLADELPSPIERDADVAERRRIHSILYNALAYRHAAFVYLYRTIYGHHRSHPLVQLHTHVALTHCVRTVAHAGPMGALLWPLFVPACEAVSSEDRELADRAFAAIERRQGMMNIERAWKIVREVWKRADKMEDPDEDDPAIRLAAVPEAGIPMRDPFSGNVTITMPVPLAGMATGLGSHDRASRGPDLWRRVSEDMGVNIVFG